MEKVLVGERVKAIPPHRCAQRMRGGRASRTPGKTKGGNCTTDPIKKFFACSPKAYKHPQYNVWNDKFRKANTGGGK